MVESSKTAKAKTKPAAKKPAVAAKKPALTTPGVNKKAVSGLND